MGDNVSILLAGPATRSQELFVDSLESLEHYSGIKEPDEIDIDQLKQDLRSAAQRRKRALMNEHTQLQFGMSLEHFYSTGRAQFGDAYFQELVMELRMLHLGANMIVATFGQSEGILLRVSGDG